jgi:peptidoglycan/LPS O-acetylase OafA/YrhL
MQLDSDNPTSLEIMVMSLFLYRGSLLWPSFLIGIALYQLRYYVPYSKAAAIGLVGASILVSAFGDQVVPFSNARIHSITLPLIGYLTVVIGLSPIPRLPGFGTGDYSYGLYLYHVPFLQLLIYCFPQTWTGDGWWSLFLVGFPLSLLAAVISWHLFEYPVLKLRSSFRIKHQSERRSPAAVALSPALAQPMADLSERRISSPL